MGDPCSSPLFMGRLLTRGENSMEYFPLNSRRSETPRRVPERHVMKETMGMFE